MENNILYDYELLASDLLIIAGALEVVYSWFEDLPSNELGRYEFLTFKAQYADVLHLAISNLNNLSQRNQEIIDVYLQQSSTEPK